MKKILSPDWLPEQAILAYLKMRTFCPTTFQEQFNQALFISCDKILIKETAISSVICMVLEYCHCENEPTTGDAQDLIHKKKRICFRG